MEMTADVWRTGIGLSSADADRVIPLRDDWIAILRHHAQVARLQLEMDMLACTSFEMDALEPTQSDARGSLDIGKFEIKLDNLVSRCFASIGHRDIGGNGLSGIHSLRRQVEIAVAKLRIAEPITERIQRLAIELPVGPICHPVVFKVG